MFFVPPDLNATISELSAMRLFRETPCAAAPSLPTPHARSLALFYGFSMVSIRSPCPSARISMKALRLSARAIARCRSGLSNGGLSRFDDQIDAGIGWRCSTARQSRWRSPATARPCAYASTALYRPAESGRCVSRRGEEAAAAEPTGMPDTRELRASEAAATGSRRSTSPSTRCVVMTGDDPGTISLFP